MKLWKSPWRLGRCALLVGLAAAGAAPAAQAHHAPGEGSVAARSVAQPPARVITVTQPRGFDFGSASVGAGGAIGAALVVGGSAVLIRRSRTRKTVAL
jgi:hypothetical protein